MKRYFLAVKVLSAAYLRRFLRDKTALFFTFLFPLLFLLVFGSLNRNNTSISFDVAIINQASNQFADEFSEQIEQNELFSIQESVSTRDDATERMGRGELDTVIVLPKSFG